MVVTNVSKEMLSDVGQMVFALRADAIPTSRAELKKNRREEAEKTFK